MSSAQYANFVLEQLATLSGVTTKRFFGGVGLSTTGTQFGFIMGSTLYFVVDDGTRPKYEQMGSKCFSYDTKKKRVDVRKYYEVPSGLLEDSEPLVELAREAIAVAVMLKTRIAPKRTKRSIAMSPLKSAKKNAAQVIQKMNPKG